ncbi:MAG: fibronectin type III domain-containing protein [Treponema sp.]|nr:fibronectin type III domain-containing protein [Treponema sp.]
MLKKNLFYVAAISAVAAVVILGCGSPESDNSVSFIISNQSSYDLENVRIAEADQTFTTANLSVLQKGTLSKGVLLPPGTGKTIVFTRKDAGVECSIGGVSVSIREDWYVIRDDTVVALSGGREVELRKLVAFPSGVSVSAASSSGATISWNAVSGAEGYYIYRSSTADGAYSKLTPDGVTGISYTDTDLSSGATYYYKVSAKNVDGESEPSSPPVSVVFIPDVPSSVSAEAPSSTSVTISWDSVSGATEYYIYRSSSESGAYSKLTTTPASVTGTSYTDTGLSSNTTYYYKVAAANSGGTSEQSFAVSVATLLAPPSSPPSSVSAVGASSTSITINWDAASGAEEYYIYRSLTEYGAYSKLTTTPVSVTGTSYTDTGLSSGITYYYKVAAYNSGGTSEQSVADSATTLLAPPSSVSATAASSSSITVSWSSVSNATRYYIYRSTSAEGSYTQLTYTTSFSYTDTALSSGATYYYKVAAYSNYSSGEQSVAVSAITLLAPPSSVSAVGASSTSITISWNSSSGAGGYYIYRSLSYNGVYLKLTTDSVTGTSYTDTGLSADISYYYKIAAYNSDGESGMSSVYGAAAPLLSPPSSVTATATSSSGRITVSWGSVSNATRYYIYRSTSPAGDYQYQTYVDYSYNPSYTDTGLSSGTTYYYKIAAYNNAGVGDMSSAYGSATAK